jgi:hypothetical protein
MIPWDDPNDDRPPWLPAIDEPVDAETAARIMAHYGPEIAANLEWIAGELVRRHPRFAKPGVLTVRMWTANEIVQRWGPELEIILVGFVGVDDRPSGQSFHDVLVMIDKGSGELYLRDYWGLLGE